MVNTTPARASERIASRLIQRHIHLDHFAGVDLIHVHAETRNGKPMHYVRRTEAESHLFPLLEAHPVGGKSTLLRHTSDNVDGFDTRHSRPQRFVAKDTGRQTDKHNQDDDEGENLRSAFHGRLVGSGGVWHHASSSHSSPRVAIVLKATTGSDARAAWPCWRAVRSASATADVRPSSMMGTCK